MLDRIASTPQERATNDWAVIRRLWTYMRDDWRDLLVMLVFLILSAGSQAGGPALIGIAIDRFITEGNSVGLRNAMLWLLVVYVLGFVGFVGQVRILGRVAQRLLKRLRTDIFEHVQKLSLKYFSGGQAGDLMSRLVNDTDVIGNLFSQSLTQSLGAIFALIGIVVAMFVYNWILALATLTVIPVMFLVTAFFSRRARSAFRETRETLGQLSTNLEEGISSVRESQAFGRTQQNIQQFQRNNTAYRNSSVRAGGITAAFSPTIDVLSTIATAIVAGVGGYLAIAGLASVGTVAAFLLYAERFFRPVQQISTLYTQAQAAFAASERVFDLLDIDPDLFDKPDAETLPAVEGRVVFDHVSFSYGRGEIVRREAVDDGADVAAMDGMATSEVATNGTGRNGTGRNGAGQNGVGIFDAAASSTNGAPADADGGEYNTGYVLRDVSLEAAPGTTVALVGPTGAGKTTLVNLIGRFYDVDEGAVLVDGHDVRDVTRRSLRQQMGVVPQDAFLFSGTIADNIRYGQPDVPMEQVIEAAKAARVHPFIEAQPEGYETKLGDRGGTLSQGQRQLICIARAILADPRLLILDEATSSIDTRTERLVQQALDTLLEGRTSFVIAHRLSTIRRADMILVIDDGRIVERGTHEELLAKGGMYADLYEKQLQAVSL